LRPCSRKRSPRQPKSPNKVYLDRNVNFFSRKELKRKYIKGEEVCWLGPFFFLNQIMSSIFPLISKRLFARSSIRLPSIYSCNAVQTDWRKSLEVCQSQGPRVSYVRYLISQMELSHKIIDPKILLFNSKIIKTSNSIQTIHDNSFINVCKWEDHTEQQKEKGHPWYRWRFNCRTVRTSLGSLLSGNDCLLRFPVIILKTPQINNLPISHWKRLLFAQQKTTI
jgi:hypothetical protein